MKPNEDLENTWHVSREVSFQCEKANLFPEQVIVKNLGTHRKQIVY